MPKKTLVIFKILARLETLGVDFFGHLCYNARMKNKNLRLIFDADFIQAGTKVKNEILARVLKTRKNITLIHGVAGSGKSTIAQQQGGEVIDVDTDISKATEFVVLSGAAATKSGQPSPAVTKLVKRANNVTFVIPSNLEVIRRRRNRIAVGAIDNRSEKQVKATMRAPLNNLAFVSILKKLAKKTEIVS